LKGLVRRKKAQGTAKRTLARSEQKHRCRAWIQPRSVRPTRLSADIRGFWLRNLRVALWCGCDEPATAASSGAKARRGELCQTRVARRRLDSFHNPVDKAQRLPRTACSSL